VLEFSLMARAARLNLQPGEQKLMVVHRHWWLLVRPLMWLAPILLALPGFAVVEYMLPAAELSRYATIFMFLDLALAVVVLAKWLGIDVASWCADVHVITSHRIIEQTGLVTVVRREAVLRAVQESNYSISGAGARLFDLGDLKVQTGTRGGGIEFKQIPHPRRVQALIAARAQIARDEHKRLHGKEDGAVQSALARIFHGLVDPHDTPTIELPRITRLMLRAQRRMNLLPEETVLYTSRRHLIMMYRAVIPPLALGSVGAGAASGLGISLSPVAVSVTLAGFLLWAIWGYLDWLDDVYILTSDRIIELRRTPLVFELRNAIQLRSVHDVVLRISSVSGRLCNIGALTIELGGGDPLHLTGVPHPDFMQRLIFEGIDAAVQRDRMREQERLAGTLTEWFEEYHRMQSTT
jgi:hypothetical protein